MMHNLIDLSWIINHLLAKDTRLSQRLKPFAGLCILLNIAGLRFNWQISENGELSLSHAAPDATIKVKLSTLPLWWIDKSNFQRQVDIEGNRAFALAFAQVLLALRWDIEEMLSQPLGDVAAHRLSKIGQQLINWPLLQIKEFFNTLSDYFQKESGQIMSQPHLMQFHNDVDRVRSDTDRLEKRLQALIQPIDRG